MRRGILVLVVVAMLGVVPPASARGVGIAAGATDGSTVVVRDPRGSQDPRGDLVRASLSYGEPDIVATARVARPVRPRSRHWRLGLTVLSWVLDRNGDGRDDGAIVLYNDGADALMVELHNRRGDVVCFGHANYRDRTYVARIPRTCFGEKHPPQIAFQTFLQFHRDLSSDRDRAFDFDTAPGRRFSPAAKRPPPRTVLRMRAPTKAQFGGEIELAGELLPFTYRYESIGEQAIDVYGRTPGQPWVVVAKVQTTPDGTWSVTLRPQGTTVYQARFAGAAGLARSYSRSARVDVTRSVTGNSGIIERALGVKETFIGTVDAPDAATVVELQRNTKDGWRTVKTANVDEEGGYRFGVSPASSGDFTYRFVVPGTARFAESAAPGSVTLRLYTAELAAIEPGAGDLEDVQHPNNEHIEIRNTGPVPISLLGWVIEGDSLTSARIHDQYQLPAGQTVRVHSGRGDPGAHDIYLDRDLPMWPERGGTVRVFNTDGVLIGELTYGGDAH